MYRSAGDVKEKDKDEVSEYISVNSSGQLLLLTPAADVDEHLKIQRSLLRQ